MYNLLLLSQSTDSLWKSIVTGIPHSPAAILLYLLLGASGFLIWRSNRSSE